MTDLAHGFEHEICITYSAKLQYWQIGAPERMHAIDKWLKDNINSKDYSFLYEDYGQHGEYIVRFKYSEDLLMFKLMFGV